MNFIKNLFTRKPLSPMREWERTIRKLGYKKDDAGFYFSESRTGRTVISVSESGVKIKVYAGGYGESDFLPASKINQESLKKFIRQNEI